MERILRNIYILREVNIYYFLVMLLYVITYAKGIKTSITCICSGVILNIVYLGFIFLNDINKRGVKNEKI